MAPEMWLLYM
uniref:Uncharacterized protein n=1 Tax=Arundo donax TaxID=35708 RepID=A0A0A8YRA3_ARUDO